MKKIVREALERLEEVSSDGDQEEIEDAIAELAGALDQSDDAPSTLAEVLRKLGHEEAAEKAEQLENELDDAPSDGAEAEEAEESCRELANDLHGLLSDVL